MSRGRVVASVKQSQVWVIGAAPVVTELTELFSALGGAFELCVIYSVEMSSLEQLERYTNPHIPSKTDTIYKAYSHFSSLGQVHNEEEAIYV